MALIQDIKESFISYTSISDWNNVLNDMSEELNRASLGGDISLFTNSLRTVKHLYNISDTEIDGLESLSLSTAQNIKELNILGNQTIITNIKIENFLKITALVFDIGNKITTGTTIDIDNVSNNDSNLRNGNLTDLCYNNITQSTTNLNMVGIDLGEVKDVGLIKIHHWDNASYTSPNFKIRVGNDVNSLTDIATNLNSVGLEGKSTSLFVDENCRYIIPNCVTGTNPTFWVLSEIEVFEKGNGLLETPISNIETLSFNVSQDNYITVTNTGTDINIKLYHI